MSARTVDPSRSLQKRQELSLGQSHNEKFLKTSTYPDRRMSISKSRNLRTASRKTLKARCHQFYVNRCRPRPNLDFQAAAEPLSSCHKMSRVEASPHPGMSLQ